MTKRKALFSAIAAATLALVSLTGCEKEEYGYAPTYGKIYCVNPDPKLGDTLTLSVEIKNPGNRCYKAEYTWKGDNGNFYDSKTVLDPLLQAPTMRYIPKHSGNINISMSAKFRLSMPSENGQVYDFASASGTIVVK